MCTPRDLSKSALYLIVLNREVGGMSEYERRSPVSALRRGARCLRGPPPPPRVESGVGAWSGIVEQALCGWRVIATLRVWSPQCLAVEPDAAVQNTAYALGLRPNCPSSALDHTFVMSKQLMR